MLKKLDIFLLKSYLGPFIATFFISVFVLLMQFLWKWIDDLVGKGLDFTVIAELLYYASISLIPMALPLAILLASIMTYGNLGEKFELTAIKAAGISLQRAMLPLTILTLIFSLGAFVIANDVIPYANLKMSALIWSIRNQRPELNIKPSIFNNDIEDFSIRISSKNEKTGMMYDFVVYDHTKGKVNNVCIVADSGSMKVTDDGRFMIVTLYSGVRYEEMDDKKKTSFPYQKDEFGEQSLVFNLAGFDFNKADESGFKNRYQVMNVSELAVSTDSLQRDFQKYANDLHESLTTTSYFRQSSHREKVYADSVRAAREHKSQYNSRRTGVTVSYTLTPDSAYAAEDSVIRLKIAHFRDSIYNTAYNINPADVKPVAKLDSLFDTMTKAERQRVISRVKEYATQINTTVVREADELAARQKTIARYRNAWHQKFTLSVACIIFFFIGAPLGAIIRKGGFGLPIVVSVVVFLIYYLISTAGMKMSREGLWEPWQGMWISTIVILPLGVFFTYKATVDAQLFNKEAWMKAFDTVIKFFRRKKS
ncbi:MAG: LptF/LptG family permease [Bacteroidales bacterium]|nr:LptF/LptG family permease [Bacteroidales bacterium]